MNSYEFEIELMHLSTVGKNKKCALMSKGSIKRIFIVTLNNDEFLVEVYGKQMINKVDNPDTDSHWNSLLLSMDY